MKNFTIQEFTKAYGSDDDCLDEIFQSRFGSLEVCEKCQKKTKFHRISARKCYCCQWCGFQLHPLAGTIFHKSDTALSKWFYAIYLFGVSKNGVSGKELQRQLGVTYKTAWRMARQIRLLFGQDDGQGPLKGIVEADEAYVGGYRKGNAGRKSLAKSTVIGMVERGGRAIVRVVNDATKGQILPPIVENLEPGTTLITDAYNSYKTVGGMGLKHETINHTKEGFRRGNIYTNTIEGFWSQLKRSINGTYHAVSRKHLQHYVNEFSWRYSNRKCERPLFFPMIELAAKPLR